MTTLNLSFVNTPYTEDTMRRPMASATAEFKRKKKRSFSKTLTAEDVANILGEQYHILATFYTTHAPDIIDALRDTFITHIDGVLSDNKRLVNAKIPRKDLETIERSFRQFLDRKEMDGKVAGVPTLASIKGTSHFFKTLKPGRPSFVDTGIYRASFRVKEK